MKNALQVNEPSNSDQSSQRAFGAQPERSRRGVASVLSHASTMGTGSPVTPWADARAPLADFISADRPEADEADADSELTFKPSVFFFRDALRDCETLADAVGIGMQAILELEHHKAWVLENFDVEIPLRHILSTEVEAKGLARYTIK